jgi:hypothetical protein
MRAAAGTLIGFIYGWVLVVLSAVAGGGGHGIAIPLLVSSAPIAVFNSWLVIPFFWAVLGLLIARSASPNGKALAQAALFLNYVSGFALVVLFGIPQMFSRIHSGGYDSFAIWVVVYFAGQVLAWRYIRSRRAQPQHPLPGAFRRSS